MVSGISIGCHSVTSLIGCIDRDVQRALIFSQKLEKLTARRDCLLYDDNSPAVIPGLPLPSYPAYLEGRAVSFITGLNRRSQVTEPTTPSGFSPCQRWKFLTAPLVFQPKIPSGRPASKPRCPSLIWIVFTAGPRERRFNGFLATKSPCAWMAAIRAAKSNLGGALRSDLASS